MCLETETSYRKETKNETPNEQTRRAEETQYRRKEEKEKENRKKNKKGKRCLSKRERCICQSKKRRRRRRRGKEEKKASSLGGHPFLQLHVPYLTKVLVCQTPSTRRKQNTRPSAQDQDQATSRWPKKPKKASMQCNASLGPCRESQKAAAISKDQRQIKPPSQPPAPCSCFPPFFVSPK